MIRPMLAAVAAAALTAAGAQAATVTISSAPFYSGPSAASVLCIISNYNTDATLSITSVAVVADQGKPSLTLASNTCSATLAGGGASCRFTATIPQPPDSGYACQVQTSESATVVLATRLSAMVLDASSNTLFNEPGH